MLNPIILIGFFISDNYEKKLLNLRGTNNCYIKKIIYLFYQKLIMTTNPLYPQETPYWYAIYTRPQLEKKVAEALAYKGMVVYCPLQKVVRQWSDRKKVLEIPAFKGYVFVQIHDTIRWQVLATNGVLNFVCYNGKPAHIPVKEMETMRLFFEGLEDTILSETDLQVSDYAQVYSGAMMGLEGEVIALENKYAVLRVPSLGLQMQVKVERRNVERVIKTA